MSERKETREGRERTFLDCVLGDSTGIVDASFFNEDLVQKNAILAFKNVMSKVVREHIQIQRGRNGRIQETESTIRETNTTNNISARAYELEK